MKVFYPFSFLLFVLLIKAQTYQKPLISAIKMADIKTDMYQLAADEFNGREAGTLDELKEATWLANKAKEAGMQPAGEKGTFFQFFELQRFQISPHSSVAINGKELKIWKDVLVWDIVQNQLEADVLYLGDIKPSELASKDIKGKVVAINASKGDIKEEMFLFEKRYPTMIRANYYKTLTNLGAKGVIFITDDIAEKSWAQTIPQLTRGMYGVEGFRDKVDTCIPVLWIHKENEEWVKNNPKISIHLNIESYKYPSVNVIGKIEGTDPKLKNEYVLISGHHDHDGIRLKYGQDSIYNGADDNASACVALLAMGRAYQKQKSKRSILFVFHGAEERYLLGSFYHSAHPVVPKENIVAVLNADMIGRNDVNEAALLGGNDPHKNSDDLVKMAMEANNEGTKFKLREEWDKPEHPEYFYFRSDHLPYARKGIPALFFTSVLHSQYHTPMDEAENIDYLKLYKMTEWMYRTSWKVANEPNRPKVLPNVKLER